MGAESRHIVSDPLGIMTSSDDTTGLFLALRNGDRHALDRLMPRVYEELKRLAHRALARRGGGGTLRTTDLVHETYLKLVDQSRVVVADQAHFFALAATAMRHIVIDYARSRRTQKRGGGWRRVSLDSGLPGSEERLDDLIELDDALKRLEGFDERLSSVVECRFFAGMSVKETAEALDVAPRTADRAWERAKAWLYREIHAS